MLQTPVADAAAPAGAMAAAAQAATPSPDCGTLAKAQSNYHLYYRKEWLQKERWLRGPGEAPIPLPACACCLQQAGTAVLLLVQTNNPQDYSPLFIVQYGGIQTQDRGGGLHLLPDSIPPNDSPRMEGVC